MASNDDIGISFLDRWGGKKPPITGTSPAIDQTAMLLIGYNIVQWSMLCDSVEFTCKFWSRFPEVPADIRDERVRPEITYKIAYLERVAEIAFSGKKKGAAKFLAENFAKIRQAKHIRDALAHGSFELSHNETPGQVTVLYKRKRYTYTHDRLSMNAVEIGEATTFFSDFLSWINHEILVELSARLHGQLPQTSVPTTLSYSPILGQVFG